MKRYVHSADIIDEKSLTGKPFEFQHGRKRFMGRIVEDNNIIRSGQITQIHPYDDADYAWAKIEGPVVKFIRDGKVIDKMTIFEYDDEYYEHDWEYIDEVLDTIAVELINLDRNTKPVMVHN